MFSQSAPARSVAERVDAFWSRIGMGGSNRILPDGCLDFVFDLDAGSARVIGPMSSARLVPSAPRRRLFGVRFRPGVAVTYLTVPARELLDNAAPLDAVTENRAFRLAERVADARNDTARRDLVTEFVLESRSRTRALDGRVRNAVAELRKTPLLPLRALAQAVGVGERQIERLFHEHVGTAPKHYARVVRLERTVARLNAFEGTQAELAAHGGFADESHLLREFRALAGATPRELLARDVGFVQAAFAGSP